MTIKTRLAKLESKTPPAPDLVAWCDGQGGPLVDANGNPIKDEARIKTRIIGGQVGIIPDENDPEFLHITVELSE